MEVALSDIMQDAQRTDDLWFAVCLVYVGCDIVEVDCTSRQAVFTIICPRMDFEIYQEEFRKGRMQIADAKAFGVAYDQVLWVLRPARQARKVYQNPDFQFLQRQMNMR